MKMHTPRQKQIVWILSGGAFILIVAWYVITSIDAWRDIENNSVTTRQNMKNQVVSTMKNSNISTETRQISLKTAMEATVTCKPHPMFAWQEQVIGSAKKYVRACEDNAAYMVKLRSVLERLVHYFENEKKMTELLQSIVPADTLKEHTWKKEHTKVQQVADATKDLAVHGEYKAVHSEAVKRLNNVTAAWKSLLSAHKAEDRSKFTTAKAKLLKAYGYLQNIADTSDKTLTILLKELDNVLQEQV